MAAQTQYSRQHPGHHLSLKMEFTVCRVCSKMFSGRAAFLLHLQDAWLHQPTSHHHCHICAVVFDNDRERSAHIQKTHALQAKLICPSCRCGPFLMPNHLMAHLKPDCCPAYNKDAISRFASKSESVRSIQTPQWSAASQVDCSGRSHVWTTPTRAEIPQRDLTHWSQIRKSGVKWRSSLDSWGKNTVKVFIEANSQLTMTRQGPVKRTAPEAGDKPHDPNNPNFNAERYISSYSSRYTCPEDGCQKTFKPHELQKFKGHLKTHLVTKDHQCPSCCKKFSTVAALITHMEHQESGCELQHSADFGAWLLKVTGGIVTSSSKTAEGKSIFETSSDAQRELKSPLLVNVRPH